MGWSDSELVSDIRAGARQQRLTTRTVYSAIVPMPSEPGPVDELSEVIYKVEKDGWILEQVTTLPATAPSAQTRVLLIFRADER